MDTAKEEKLRVSRRMEQDNLRTAWAKTWRFRAAVLGVLVLKTWFDLWCARIVLHAKRCKQLPTWYDTGEYLYNASFDQAAAKNL